MVASTRCATQNELSQLLNDRIVTDEQLGWSEHLEHCSKCQSQLLTLAAPDTLWEESRQQLTEWDNVPESCDAIVEEVLAHYRVEGTIGYGGMATVYRGFDPQLHRPVAIKVLHHHLARTGSSRQRFLREAQSAAAIAHPNVIPIYGVHQAAGKSFLVMPLITGGSLQQRIDREGPIGLEDMLRIALQIAEALDAAHTRGVIHRDVKPANILLEDGNKRVVLSDFGLARTLDDAAITASGLIAGTPAYMSPEQARGEIVDHRSDLYSLGSVMYAMCTGHSPFQATSTLKILREVSSETFPTVHRFQEQLPIWVDGLIARFTTREPSRRIENAAAAIELIRECMLHVLNPSHSLPRGVQVLHTAENGNSIPSRSLRKILLAFVLIAVLGAAYAVWRNENQSVIQSIQTSGTSEPESSIEIASPTQPWNDPLEIEITQLRSDLERIIAPELFTQTNQGNSQP
ncbi:MAG: serine/threonine-protein kinase [Planctomycetota bacterium]|nr:serine/threonine-protein kinase [Planctomycetota bacterium]